MAVLVATAAAWLSVATASAIDPEPPDRAPIVVPAATLIAASRAGVDPIKLFGAELSTGLSAEEYLYQTGELERPAPPAPSLPIGGALGRRLYCIEEHESGHTATALNRSSGARGWLQWLPSTARAWGVVIGDRTSEWNAAARIAALGERFFVSQWVPLQQGLC